MESFTVKPPPTASSASVAEPTRRALLLLSSPCDKGVLLKALAGAVDWALLVDLARRGGVAGLVANSIQRAGSLLAPRNSMLQLVGIQLATQARNSFLLDRAGEICREAARRGLTVAPLKGTALLMDRPYHDLGSRTLNDIDLLAAREEYGAASRPLVDLGYTAEERARHALRHEHHVRFWREEGAPVLVELHWTPFYTLYGDGPSSSAVFHRLVEHSFRGTRFTLLDLEDTLLANSTHLAHHRFRGNLKWLVDIAALLAQQPAVDWRLVKERAAALGAVRALQHCLWLVGHLLACPVPDVGRSTLPLRLLRKLNPPEGLVNGMPQPPVWQRTLIDLVLQDEIGRAFRYFLFKVPELIERWWGREVPDRLVRGEPGA